MAELWGLPDDPIVPEVREAARALHLTERYAALDRDPAFPWVEFRGLGERRLLGLTVAPSLGGRGLALPRAAVALFHLGYLGGTAFAKLALQPEFSSVLAERGTPEQVETWFRPLVRGERLVGNQITEPEAGSDARALALEVVPEAGGYVLTGTKSEAAFAADAHAALVYGRLSTAAPGQVTAFLVPQDLPGIKRTVDPPDMGERWQRRGQVRYDHVRVPVSARIGAEGEGFAPLLGELARERGLLAALYLGVARASLDETVSYVGEREAFGRRLSDNQAVAFPLVDVATELRAAWHLTIEALSTLESGAEASARTALAKVFATRVALRTIDLAIQFHGGSGYSSRRRHEQRYRDVRSGPVAHGPSEVLRTTAARVLWPAKRRS